MCTNKYHILDYSQTFFSTSIPEGSRESGKGGEEECDTNADISKYRSRFYM